MSTGVEHVCRHGVAQRGLKGEGERHERPLLATQRTWATLDGLVVGIDMATGWEHVRAVLLVQVGVVGDWDVDAPSMRGQGPRLERSAARLKYAFLGVLISESDAVKQHGTVRLEVVQVLYYTVWIDLLWNKADH